MFWLVATALAAPVLVPADAVDEHKATRLFEGRRLALLVGPSSFDDAAFAPLQFTDDDARSLGTVLSDPTRGDFDRVWTLTDHTDAASVRAAMAELSAASVSRDDVVVVYFSTHGTLSRDRSGDLRQYLVLSDTEMDDVADTGLSHAEVLRWLSSLPSRRKVLVLATCHSGRGKSTLPPQLAQEMSGVKGPPPVPLAEVSEATIVLAACAHDETARESAALGHDIYTAFLLEALVAGDIDGDGAVTVTEAHDRARAKTYAFTNGAQRPYALAEILGSDPIVLVGTRGQPSAGTLGSYRSRLDGLVVAVDGQTKGELPALVSVPPGAHRVEVLDGKRVIGRQRVHVRAGGQIDVASLMRMDQVRVGSSAGWQAFGLEGVGGPAIGGEIQFPRLLGNGWEIIAHGSTVARWPYPTLEGGLEVERSIIPGAVQLRVGGGLEGFLLGAPGDPPLLAPSLIPVPVASLAWLPPDPLFARLSASGGYAWYTSSGAWDGGWTARMSLAVGFSF